MLPFPNLVDLITKVSSRDEILLFSFFLSSFPFFFIFSLHRHLASLAPGHGAQSSFLISLQSRI